LVVSAILLVGCDTSALADRSFRAECERFVEKRAESTDKRAALEVVEWKCPDVRQNTKFLYLVTYAGERDAPTEVLLFSLGTTFQAHARRSARLAWSRSDPRVAFVQTTEEPALGGEDLPVDWSIEGVTIRFLGSRDPWPPPDALSQP
jgi:hypothetical protein